MSLHTELTLLIERVALPRHRALFKSGPAPALLTPLVVSSLLGGP
jgi:hypothetical protein